LTFLEINITHHMAKPVSWKLIKRIESPFNLIDRFYRPSNPIGPFYWPSNLIGRFYWPSNLIGRFYWPSNLIGRFYWTSIVIGQFYRPPNSVSRHLGLLDLWTFRIVIIHDLWPATKKRILICSVIRLVHVTRHFADQVFLKHFLDRIRRIYYRMLFFLASYEFNIFSFRNSSVGMKKWDLNSYFQLVNEAFRLKNCWKKYNFI
jgi:hypothetical protein